MAIMRRSLFLLAFTLLFNISNYAQTISPEVIAASGEYFVTSDVSISWTLGECVVETFQTPNASLHQGFQQSGLVYAAIEENVFDDVDVTIYPNPTSEYINISIDKNSENAFMLVLNDMKGNILKKEHIELSEKSCRVNFTGYPAGVYILELYHKDKRESYKIIKQK